MDDHVYMKKGKRYYPIGVYYSRDYLTEGVWVVSKDKNSTEITSANYMKDLFGLDKKENVKALSVGELGNLHKITEQVIRDVPFSEFENGFTYTEMVHKIVGATYENILKSQKNS